VESEILGTFVASLPRGRPSRHRRARVPTCAAPARCA